MDITVTEHEEQHEEQVEQPEVLYGLLAEFPDQDSLVHAAQSVRDTGVRRWDSYSPYPIHGVDRAMGIRDTRLPWIVVSCGVAGGVLALLMQWWTNAVDYPFNISGKPFFSVPANIPITFELIILFSAFAAFLGALALNGLPRFVNPLFKSEKFKRVTSDRFFIAIEAKDELFDESRLQSLLESCGAVSIEQIHDAAQPAKIPLAFHLIGAVAFCLALVPPLWIARDRATRSDVPRIHPVTDMDFQPKYRAQAESNLFDDGRTMRLPVEGTVARDELYADQHFHYGVVDGEFAATFPAALEPLDADFMARGEQRFGVYCAPCHGLAGDGDGIISLRALDRDDSIWIPPLSLHSDAVMDQPIGKIFNTITNGVDRAKDGNLSMPAYAAQIVPRDRWAIVLYVLALQRSRNSTTGDLPAAELETLRLRALDQ